MGKRSACFLAAQTATNSVTLLDSLRHREHPLSQLVGYLQQVHAVPPSCAALPGILLYVLSRSLFEK